MSKFLFAPFMMNLGESQRLSKLANHIIIGGGIVGSTAAFYLSRYAECNITLIDSGQGNATRAAAGIICPWLSQRRNKDWYHLTSQGANFYLQLMEDLKQAGVDELPYRQTGTLVFKNQPHLLEKLYRLALESRRAALLVGELSIYKKNKKWSSKSI